jgi:hypothetical protein
MVKQAVQQRRVLAVSVPRPLARNQGRGRGLSSHQTTGLALKNVDDVNLDVQFARSGSAFWSCPRRLSPSSGHASPFVNSLDNRVCRGSPRKEYCSVPAGISFAFPLVTLDERPTLPRLPERTSEFFLSRGGKVFWPRNNPCPEKFGAGLLLPHSLGENGPELGPEGREGLATSRERTCCAS